MPLEHKCIVASPASTTLSGCLIPGTQLVLNIPHVVSGTTTLGVSENTSLTYGYIFPTKHAIINLIEPGCLPFERTSGFRFQVYKVPTCLNLRDFINQTIPTTPGVAEKTASARGIIECIHLDNGSWERGQEFWIDGLESMNFNFNVRTLEDIGWTEGRSPIWVARSFV